MRTRRRRPFRWAAALGLAAAVVAALPARADTITLAGTTIPLRGCAILDVRGGRVHYRSESGRLLVRDLADVSTLGFDELPSLDEAEERWRAGDRDGALAPMLRALLAADDEVQQVWVRVRLARLHEARGEYVEAAGHAAAVFRMRDERYWQRLEPRCPPKEAGYAAAREAIIELRAARSDVKDPELQAAIVRMLDVAGPIYERRAAAYEGPPIPRDSTRSGIQVSVIRGGAPSDAEVRQALDDILGGPAGAEPVDPGAAVRAPEPTPRAAIDGADAIDALLEAGEFAEALTRCRRVARDPGRRDLGRFLDQYGRTLLASGRPRDAAVMFMRCALLYPESEAAPASLVEAAVIHRDVFDDARAARRLLRLALEQADRRGQSAEGARARALLSELTRHGARGDEGDRP